MLDHLKRRYHAAGTICFLTLKQKGDFDRHGEFVVTSWSPNGLYVTVSGKQSGKKYTTTLPAKYALVHKVLGRKVYPKDIRDFGGSLLQAAKEAYFRTDVDYGESSIKTVDSPLGKPSASLSLLMINLKEESERLGFDVEIKLIPR